MVDKIFVSTAYLPPAEYISLISGAQEVLIEAEENYLKQSYRNRFYILSAHGRQMLSVPVYLGSLHKTKTKDIRIDYSKRWQQVHIRALSSSYGAAPFFQYYFDTLERIIGKRTEFLLDLNSELLAELIRMLNFKTKLSYTSAFSPLDSTENDYRYNISPKKISGHQEKEYSQVFNENRNFTGGLSIVDLLFNMGPDAVNYLQAEI